MTWRWEHDPSEAYVIGEAPPAFVAEVEKMAGELVWAAAAFYLDGTQYEGRHRTCRQRISFSGMNAYTSAK